MARKGGSGKSGSLREQFNYYKRRLKERLIEEQAFIEARGGFSFSGKPSTLFKNLNYDEIMTNGVTRKEGNKTVTYTGQLAVKLQIESLRKRASKSYQTEQFILNYTQSLVNVGFSYKSIEKVRKAFDKASTDKIAILIDKNILPQIQMIYAEQDDEEDLLNDILNALSVGVSTAEVKEIRAKKAKLKPIIKEKFDILGW